MFRNGRIIFLFLLAWALCACEGTTFQSSVPAYPVRVVIDTKVGEFVHFQPTATGSHVVVNKEGYFLNGKFIKIPNATDMWGYGGVIVYVNYQNGYDAYDLCCPNCAALKQSCTIDGFFATCPHCGEQYDLSSGTAAPQKGIAHEFLRRLNIINSDGKLTVTQRQ